MTKKWKPTAIALQLGLAVDLGLIIVHGAVPDIKILPIAGSELAQVAVTVLAPIAFVQMIYAGRRFVGVLKELWWDDEDEEAVG